MPIEAQLHARFVEWIRGLALADAPGAFDELAAIAKHSRQGHTPDGFAFALRRAAVAWIGRRLEGQVLPILAIDLWPRRGTAEHASFRRLHWHLRREFGESYHDEDIALRMLALAKCAGHVLAKVRNGELAYLGPEQFREYVRRYLFRRENGAVLVELYDERLKSAARDARQHRHDDEEAGAFEEQLFATEPREFDLALTSAPMLAGLAALDVVTDALGPRQNRLRTALSELRDYCHWRIAWAIGSQAAVDCGPLAVSPRTIADVIAGGKDEDARARLAKDEDLAAAARCAARIVIAARNSFRAAYPGSTDRAGLRASIGAMTHDDLVGMHCEEPFDFLSWLVAAVPLIEDRTAKAHYDDASTNYKRAGREALQRDDNDESSWILNLLEER